MPLRLPRLLTIRLLTIRLWGALLLAAIGLQAAQPVVHVFERVQGSAFSSATADVAIAARAGSAAVRLAALPLPVSLLPSVLVAGAQRAAPRAGLPLVRPRSTAPPVYPPLPGRAAPRAPPLA